MSEIPFETTDRPKRQREDQPDGDRSVKVGHLVTGLVFLGLAGSWALRSDAALGDLEIAVVVPVVLVLAGVVGLVAMVVGNRRRARRHRATYARQTPQQVPQPMTQHASDPHPEPTQVLDHPEENR